MKTLIIALILYNIAVCSVAQQAQVITFSHTVRWLDESKFPNYFMDSSIRDSIYSDIRKNLEKSLDVSKIEMPAKVEYKIISGFGKPKKETKSGSTVPGKSVEIYSVLTRETSGYAVFWSVQVVVKNDGKTIQQKEVKCEIENANTAGYLQSVRWLSGSGFRNIFISLFCDALGTGEPVGAKVVVGSISEKEKEVRSWFPNSTGYLLKTSGAMQSGFNFSALLVKEQDTIVEMSYRNKPESFFEPVYGKEILAQLFTDITNIGTEYTIVHKETISGLLEFRDVQKVKIQLDWIAEITRSTTSDDIRTQTIVPLIGRIAIDDQPSGEFVYELITEVIESGETSEKENFFNVVKTENTFGTSVLHRIKGNLNNTGFVAEYNELFGISEIRINNETLASMIFQNCNPQNLQSFNEGKISKNKKFVTTTTSNTGKPKLKTEEKQEWYPVLIKNNASTQEINQSCTLLVCLFFAMGNM